MSVVRQHREFTRTKEYRYYQFLKIVQRNDGKVLTLRHMAEMMDISMQTMHKYSKKANAFGWINPEYVSNPEGMPKGLFRILSLTDKGKAKLEELEEKAVNSEPAMLFLKENHLMKGDRNHVQSY